jgi:cholest-4-en-3-one 26-monooxygenase
MTQTTCPFGRCSANPQGASRLPQGYDFTDPDVLVKGIPVTEFAKLRKTAPVWWNEQTDSIFDDGGYG